MRPGNREGEDAPIPESREGPKAGASPREGLQRLAEVADRGGSLPTSDVEHPLLPLFRSASPLRVGMLLVVLGVLGFLAYLLRSVTGPFLIAVALAYIVAPLVDRAERWRVPRTVTALALSFSVVLLAFGVVALVVPLAVAQTMRLLEAVPGHAEQLVRLVQSRFPTLLPADASNVLLSVWSEVKHRAPELLGTVGSYAADLVARGANFLTALGSSFLVPLFMFFLLREWSRYRERALVLLPAPMQDPVGAKLHQIGETLSAYVRGIFTVGSILAVVYALGLTVIGVPLGFLIGVIAGYAYAVPFASPIIGIGLSVLVSVLDSASVGEIVAILGLFAVGGAVEGFVLTPRIVGEFVGLSPLAVILSVLVSGALFGVGGVVLALPVAAILNVIVRDLLQAWRASRLYQTGLRAGPVSESGAFLGGRDLGG